MKDVKKTFEERMTELETLISKLESGNVPLEEMISLHEKGMFLYEGLSEELDSFEKRLKKQALNNE